MSNIKNAQVVSGFSIAVIVLMLAGTVARAADVTAEFRAGYMESDNIFLAPDFGIDSSMWTAGLSLAFNEETARTATNIRLTADYVDYEELFDPEWFSGMNADLTFTFVPERFFWVFENMYGQQLLDPLSSPNPGNRENVNFFSTGPTVQVPMGTRFFLGLKGRYSSVIYSESNGDDRRVSGELGLGRRANNDTTYSIIVRTEKIELVDRDITDDFDINEALVNYTVNSARNVVNIELGYTEVDQGVRKLDGSLARVDWTRVASRTQRLLMSLGTQYSTDGDLFRFAHDNDRDLGDVVDVNGNGTPFRNDYFYGRYNVDTDRTKIVIDAEYSRDDYEFDSTDDIGFFETLDRDVARFSFDIERDITRKVFVTLVSGFRITEFENTGRKDEDILAELTFGFRFSDVLSTYIRGQHLDRDSTDAIFSFTENRFLLGMTYVPAWGRE